MTRRALKKSEQSRTKCVMHTGPTGGKNRLCVEGRRYGFIGSLYAKSGGGSLPVPTGRARTAETAMKNAKRFLKNVGKKRRR